MQAVQKEEWKADLTFYRLIADRKAPVAVIESRGFGNGGPFLKLWKTRSRLYRRRFSRSNTRRKALDENYKFHTPLVTLILKISQNFEIC